MISCLMFHPQTPIVFMTVKMYDVLLSNSPKLFLHLANVSCQSFMLPLGYLKETKFPPKIPTENMKALLVPLFSVTMSIFFTHGNTTRRLTIYQGFPRPSWKECDMFVT